MIKAIVHCSDSPQGRGDDAEAIHRWHLERGFDGIGYHYIILEDGRIQNGRPDYWVGAHAKGFNKAIGICLIGNDVFTMAQYISLEFILKDRGFKASEIKGHYQVDSKKTCPNFDMDKFLVSVSIS